MSLVKRLIASLMLVLFLLNVLGYYGILQGFKAKSMISWAQAESDEAGGSTVTIKIPITIPYAADSRGYQEISGQFEYQGEVYQLVKQKLEKDILYIVCVKDETSSMWGRAVADYVMTFSDTQDDSSESTPVPPNLIKDFISVSISLSNQTAGWDIPVSQAPRVAHFADTYCASFVHPPERA